MSELLELCKKAKQSKYITNNLNRDEKDKVLNTAADLLIERADDILIANALDIAAGEAKGMHAGLIDRLKLDSKRISAISNSLREIAELDDPCFRILEERTLPNGLNLKKISVPLGVVGIIYESRPNVTADAFGLCFKAGNSVVLKGGADAFNSNKAIAAIIREALGSNGIDPDVCQLIESTDREITKQFMTMKEYIDVLIPRGGAGLISSVVDNATIPVIETGTGNCHIYVDESADLDMAVNIINNAKTQRIGVCNACESLVVNSKIAASFLPKLKVRLDESNVELRADKEALEHLDNVSPATEADYGMEYLDYILSIKTVDCLDEAIEHINRYSTGHSESIITNDAEHAERFLREIDSACVYVNASTRFSDGGEFGLGGEIGISTQRLHARGPMGLKELNTYKYNITGDGQIR